VVQSDSDTSPKCLAVLTRDSITIPALHCCQGGLDSEATLTLYKVSVYDTSLGQSSIATPVEHANASQVTKPTQATFQPAQVVKPAATQTQTIVTQLQQAQA
jgi:hypothetical protein